MTPNADPGGPPSRDSIQALLAEIAPHSTLLTVEPLPGSYSNYTHLVRVRAYSGTISQMVIRRYAVFGSYDRGQKAHREFKALELAQRHGIPVPEPLYLDDTGQLLGTPGIVTRFVPGDLVSAPPDPARRARSLATMLARIHSVPCDAAARTFLLDADAEASWFLRTGSAPDYMRAHPDGVSAWQTIHDLWPNREPAPAGLVHIDYWSGNVLWGAGRIVAVVDWEEAAHGEPGIDVAYCRMDMVLCGLAEAADEFLRAYQAETGRPVPNLGLWELAAGARPMFHGAGWIDQSPSRERFRQFLAAAMARAAGGERRS